MNVVPVLDLLKGQVVHGVAGQRANYRPIKSRLTNSPEPLDVATALHRHFGFTTFYVADLDAIGGTEPAFSTFHGLQALGFRLWVDAGVRNVAEARALADSSVARIIAALETLPAPKLLAEICRDTRFRAIFSLDLHAGQPVRPSNSWHNDAWTILEQAMDAGVRAVLLLDLARVGMRAGTGTQEISARLAKTCPHLEIIAGGGIRDADDLRRLESLGISTALMATALHDGSVTPADLANWLK
jgi:phosphoribosylformimino-5-aminoimidazole carboxamide ribotide isomerase